MSTYLGGEIKPECRGGFAVVITHARDTESSYDIYCLPLSSPDFLSLTGIRKEERFPVDRVYIGVSPVAAKPLLEQAENLRSGATTIESLDSLLVLPYFLARDQAAA